MRRIGLLLAVLCAACARDSEPDRATGDDLDSTPAFEPPVATNPEPPVRYPTALFEAKTEGTVVLRLYVDETGSLVADSTRIAEGSGYPALDSAALAAVPDMRFAPARRNGTPVGTAFLQPIHFRHPEGDVPGSDL